MKGSTQVRQGVVVFCRRTFPCISSACPINKPTAALRLRLARQGIASCGRPSRPVDEI